MEDKDLWTIIGVLIVVLLLGLTCGYILRGDNTETITTTADFDYNALLKTCPEKTCTPAPFNYDSLMDLCPECEDCATTETVTEVIEFSPIDELNAAWDFVKDNWKDGDDYTASGDDFEDILGICGGEDYDLEDIEFDIEDEFTYKVTNYDRNKYKLIFWLDAEYDNECENTIKVTVEYYRNRDPTYTFLIR